MRLQTNLEFQNCELCKNLSNVNLIWQYSSIHTYQHVMCQTQKFSFLYSLREYSYLRARHATCW